MAVAVLGSAMAESYSLASSISINYTVPAGSDRLLIGAHHVRRGTAYDSISISDGTTSFTLFNEFDGPNNAVFADEYAVYYLKEADIQSGSQTYTANCTPTARNGFYLIALSGVDQTTPLENYREVHATQDDLGVETITSGSDDVAIDLITTYQNEPLITAGQTQIQSAYQHDAIWMALSYIVGEASATFDWTWTSSRYMSWAGWNVRAGGGGGGPSFPVFAQQ